MPDRRRRDRNTPAAQPQQTEAAQLTQQLLDAGYTKRHVAQILGRDPSLVSQFFTKGKGAAFVPALRRALEAMHTGAATTPEELHAVVDTLVQRRTTATGRNARVRAKNVVGDTHRSSLARAGKQHIASGASRLRPVIAGQAEVGGRVAFTVRAKRSAFVYDAGSPDDSPGLRRGVVQRADGTEERSYGAGLGPGQAGLDATEWKGRVDAAGGDVAAAVKAWLVSTHRLAPDAVITHLEVRGWRPAGRT
ncbi:helix-turn-helix domain containing protein [Kitasatospora sp. NPDC048365]|uniref:helix-turn-helix domain containing protein n=1 Tax=Kitasatospora sp. NPDC048365 TaxID=3364050 RepID=UPI0037142616